MARKIEGLVINKEDLDNSISYTAWNIPSHDSTATIPEKAYPLDKIIFKGEWDYLLDVLELLQSGAEIRPNSHPSFVCNRIHRLMEIQVRFSSVENDSIAMISLHMDFVPQLSTEKINLLISFVLVLTLFADNFWTDLSDIAKDLRMTPVSLGQHYENLVCKLS
ncbi:hypothetical protein NE237_022790 [Protea cynaroides]|uniref:Uncharacterized protein n=1 Tax=Protea cynaroides TaxID=273540 RepID=A0A9Q0K4J3_9MAGN|nr:hypothetical protein NE237_022790 [Protea cynaroides]